jgi:tripartite-type tricarboxylate transporter receptor subunit TctC
MINRRGLLAGLAIADLSSAQAQPVWQPTRPVQLVVGFAPGGGGDLIARAIAQAVTPLYPQPLLVLNRASGAIAAQYVAAQ